MSYSPQFSEEERTPQQRREAVKWAVGVSMSQGGSASPELAALYHRYIAGEIDLAFIRAELSRLYPQQPTADPRYQAVQPDRYYPVPVEAAPPEAATVSFHAPQGRVSFVWTVPEDLDVIGEMAVYLHLDVQGADDVSLFAGLRKLRAGVEVVFEGSYGFSGDMVSKGWQRAAQRELDPALSSPAQPVHTYEREEPLRPGEVVPVVIALRPQATRLRKGEQLRLDIQGHWFYPRSVFRGQFPAAYQPSGQAQCRLHTGSGYAAYLLVGTRPVPESFAP